MKNDIGGSNTPAEVKDLWRTPPEVFAYFEHHYNLKVDIACVPETALCDTFITPEQDALKQDWAAIAEKAGGGIWCNPPYSQMQPWVDKAIEASENGATVVMLTHGNYDAKWFSDIYKTADKIFLLGGGRLSFIRADTGERGGGNKRPSIFAIWRGKMQRKNALIKMVDRNELIEKGEKLIA